jgi:hypothetical protein
MTRSMSDINLLSDFCIRFCNIIEKYTEYIVVSGFVAIASGRTRGTEDIDMIIRPVSIEQFIKMHAELIKNGFNAMQGTDPKELYNDYIKDNLSLRYTFKDEPLPEMEMKFSKDALDEYQLKTKTKLPLTNINIWYSSINMNIAFKEELLKSPKDLEDSKHLKLIYNELVDEKEIAKIKGMIRRYRL